MVMKRWAVAVLLALLGGSAQAQSEFVDSTFVGWSKDGSHWLLETDQQKGMSQLYCATDPWAPPPLLAKGAPELYWGTTFCVEYSNDEETPADERAPAAWRAAIVKVEAESKLPAGVSLVYDKKASKGRVDQWTFKGPSGSGACVMPKLGEVTSYYWRRDGKALALLMSETIDDHTDTYLVHCDLAHLWNDVPSGDRKAASAANTRGMKLYKAKKWAEAAAAFAEAVRLDASYPTGHYDLASVAAIVGDLPVVRRELAWARASRNPEALRLLGVALSDPDLDAATVDPAVRKLIGMSPLGRDVGVRVAERHGKFSREAAGCEQPEVVLDLARNGSFTLESTKVCGGKRQSEKTSGKWKWKQWEAPIALSGGKAVGRIIPDGAQLTAARCPGSPSDLGCVALAGVILHPGRPEVSGGYKW